MVLITGSNDGKHALIISAVDGIGPGAAGGSAEAHADDAGASAAFAHNVIDGPVEARENDGGGALEWTR